MRVCLLLVALAVSLHSSVPKDPYHALGLQRGANIKEVKKAYKALVKEWHPDKNDSPKAAERFMEVSKAYEVLGDATKKERYDRFGTIDEYSSPGGEHHHFNGFESFFFHGGFDTSSSFFTKHRINVRTYLSSILERSNTQPFLIFAFSGYCRSCFALEPIWKETVEDIEPLGYGIATVDAMYDGSVLERLRVSRLPTIIALVEGRAIHFKGDFNRLTSKALRRFAIDALPNTLVFKISQYDNLKRFIDQAISTNKVSIVVLGSTPEPKLRFLLSAMKVSPTARFGYVNLNDGTKEVREMREAMSIKCTNCENILIFNEFPQDGPVARLSISKASELSKESLDTLLDNNKFLLLPRVSSGVFFDGVCPLSSRSSRVLCVWLVSTSPTDEAIESFRTFVQKHNKMLKEKKLHVAYISASAQSDFLRPFMATRSAKVDESLRDVLVMWRNEANRGRFSWIEGAWPVPDPTSPDPPPTVAYNLIKQLEAMVEHRTKVEQSVSFGEMKDEHEPNVFVRFSKKAMRLLERVWFEIAKEETYPVLSVVVTFLLIMIVGYVITQANESQKSHRSFPSTRTASTDTTWHPEDPKTTSEGETLQPRSEHALHTHERRLQRAYQVMNPMMHELRAESYFGMVRLLKPGCRSIICFVDDDHKTSLLQQFSLAVYPLRNNKTFSFGFLNVDKNVEWFRRLLELTLPNDEETMEASAAQRRLKTINPKQTLGTVLVLCGWKLYFCMYHPMHAMSGKKTFVGMEDDGETENELSDKSSEEDVEVCRQRKRRRESFRPNVSNVLNGLPNWVDRLLEGSIRRYYIPEWPDNLH